MIKTGLSAIDLNSWLKSNYKAVLLSVIIACISFPAYNLVFEPGIDGPLPWVFNYFANGHFNLCRNILFPHGPLAFLLNPLIIENNLVIAIIVTLLCSVFLCMSVFRLYSLKKEGSYVLPAILILLVESLCDLQLLLVALTLSLSMLFHITNEKKYLVFAVFFSVFNLFIKTYGGVICFLIITGETVFSLTRKDFKTAGLAAGIFILVFYAFWLTLFHGFVGSVNFLRGQFELSLDNSEAVSFYQDNNWWYITICLLSLVLIPFLSHDNWTKHLSLIMLLPFFAAWKHAMARADNSHVNGFLNLLILFIFMIWLIGKENNIRVIIFGMVSICAFTLAMATTPNDYSNQKNIAPFKPFNLFNLVMNYDSLAIVKNCFSYDRGFQDRLSDSVLKILGNKSVDIFPWNYSFIAANHLNWTPRPTLHSYAMYTRWLDQLNANHFLFGNAPRFIIWETDEVGGKLSGIDHRYLLNDGPKTILVMFSNYKLRYKDPGILLFEKRKTPITPTVNVLTKPLNIKYDSLIDVPETKPGSVLRAKIKIRKSFTGYIKSLFYKGEGYSIHYELNDTTMYKRRIVPKNAEHGLWINPLILHPENNEKEQPIKRIRIVCNNKTMVQPEFSIQFEEIIFNPDTSFAELYFNKR